MKKIFFCFIVFQVVALTVWSQSKGDSTGLKLFFEKAYLHVDREYYASGEDIWYKAYLVNGQSNYSTNTSNNLYVELISPEAKVVARNITRMDNGLGIGDFKLNVEMQGGKYRIRAYTNWMRNFSDLFFFEKEIHVVSIRGNRPRIDESEPATSTIDFFPEGGSLVDGVTTIVAFKATGPDELGCKVKGHILTSQGDTVATLAGTHLGMGLFSMLPFSTAEYVAVGTFEDKTTFRKALPPVLSKGLSLRVLASDTSSITVAISAHPATFQELTGKEILLVGRHGGNPCFSSKFPLTKSQQSIKIPKKDFPEGISKLTLYDDQRRPHSERLVYIDKRGKINITVAKLPTTHDSVKIKIVVRDNNHQPLATNLSMAAVDASKVPANAHDIVSYLLLESEIIGRIEQPQAYFDVQNANRFKQLDLLLLTQGWRDFKWRKLADTKINIAFMPEPGLTVSGRVRQLLVNKPLPDMNVSMRLTTDKVNILYKTKTDAQGRYFLDGTEWYGYQTLKLASQNSKGEPKGWIQVDTTIEKTVEVPEPKILTFYGSPEMAHFKNEMQKFFLKADTVKMLDEVSVMGSDETLRGMPLMKGGYKDYNFTITSEDHDYTNLGAFLNHRVPNTSFVHDSIVFLYNGKPHYPFVFINRKHSRIQYSNYTALQLKDIRTVSVQHRLSSQVMDLDPMVVETLSNVSDINDIFIISLSVKPEAFQGTDFTKISTELKGYYEARDFYKVRQQNQIFPERRDLSTTLAWHPNINTDKNGEAVITFHNHQTASLISVVAEGLTTKGIPVCIVKEF